MTDLLNFWQAGNVFAILFVIGFAGFIASVVTGIILAYRRRKKPNEDAFAYYDLKSLGTTQEYEASVVNLVGMFVVSLLSFLYTTTQLWGLRGNEGVSSMPMHVVVIWVLLFVSTVIIGLCIFDAVSDDSLFDED